MANVTEKMNIPYKIPLLIFGLVTVLHVVFEFLEIGDFLPTRIAIVVAPLVVSVSCFAISKMYGNSKVFGKSYLLLGVGFVSIFLGELVFFHYVDTLLNYEYEFLGEILIFFGYPLMMAHIVINIHYFVEKLKVFQKILLVMIPVVLILIYSIVVIESSQIDEDFFYYLSFVSASSIVLALTIVAFTLFRQTVLFSAWFVLLVGITMGTIGDILYNYAYTLGIYSFGDFSNVLWIASPLIMIYALYKHQKSI